MAKVCDICGKGGRAGNRVIRHGLRKSKGGIGLHTTGVNKRRFLPNLSRIKVVVNGGKMRKTVCAACIKAGKVDKG